MNFLEPGVLHTGGTLSNCFIRDAKNGQVIVFSDEDTEGVWINEDSTLLDVTVKTQGTGLYQSGHGSTADPMIFQPYIPPSPQVFYVFPDGTTTDTTVSTNTWTALHFGNSTQPFPYTVGFSNSTNNNAVVPADGTYVFSASGRFAPHTDTNTTRICSIAIARGVDLSGVITQAQGPYPGNNQQPVFFSVTTGAIPCKQGDIITLVAYQDSQSDQHAFCNYFSGQLVR